MKEEKRRNPIDSKKFSHCNFSNNILTRQIPPLHSFQSFSLPISEGHTSAYAFIRTLLPTLKKFGTTEFINGMLGLVCDLPVKHSQEITPVISSVIWLFPHMND